MKDKSKVTRKKRIKLCNLKIYWDGNVLHTRVKISKSIPNATKWHEKGFKIDYSKNSFAFFLSTKRSWSKLSIHPFLGHKTKITFQANLEGIWKIFQIVVNASEGKESRENPQLKRKIRMMFLEEETRISVIMLSIVIAFRRFFRSENTHILWILVG